MVLFLVGAAVLIPFVLSLTLVLAGRRFRFSVVYWLTLAAAMTTVGCLVSLLPQSDPRAVLTLNWKPGMGPMGLAPAGTSLWASLATSGALLVVLLSQISRRTEFRSAAAATWLLALATANIAFFADHFLARYVALEIVALCVALVLLTDRRGGIRFRTAWTTYLQLRVGDAGLLAAIFVLLRATGTLNIDAALKAGALMEGEPLAYAAAGMLLAVWVKLGGWPFHLWSRSASRCGVTSQAWLYSTVMTNLGLYLLYRVTPLLYHSLSVQRVAFWVGAAGTAVAAISLLAQDDLREGLAYFSAVQAGLAVLAAAGGAKSAIWLSVIVMTPLRALQFLTVDSAVYSSRRLHLRWASWIFGLAGTLLLLFGLLLAWWAGAAHAPRDALLIAEAGIAVSAVESECPLV